MHRAMVLAILWAAAAAGCQSAGVRPTSGDERFFDMGYRAYQSGYWQAANDGFTDYLATNRDSPHRSEAYYYRGLARVRLNRRAEAVGDFSTATVSNPHPAIRSLAYAAMGNVYFEDGTDRQAIAAYNASLANPADELQLGRVYLRLATSLQRTGDWAAADGYLAWILKHEPNTPAGEEAARRYRAGRFSIQTGAYASEARAQQEAGRLRQAGFQPEVDTVTQDRQSLHAVRVGRARTYGEAEALAQRVNQAGFAAMVVP